MEGTLLIRARPTITSPLPAAGGAGLGLVVSSSIYEVFSTLAMLIHFHYSLREATLGDSLYQLLSNCPKLKKLFLSAVRGITERDLIHIATLGKNLEQLDLMGILNITHERVYE